jgi:hypothetical protein
MFFPIRDGKDKVFWSAALVLGANRFRLFKCQPRLYR